MTLLELECVHKRVRRGHRELSLLRNVSFSIAAGDVVCVAGARHSGRTTLLRVAAGIDPPDEGRVTFAGEELRETSRAVRRQLVFGSPRFNPQLGCEVIEQVMAPLAALRISRDEASLRAHRALERVGVAEVAMLSPDALVPAELIRVVLARAIVRQPRLVLLDEPTNGLDPLERDPLLSTIQSLAHDTGMAVLLTAGETTSVTGSDRVLRLIDGELIGRTAPASAEVVELRRASEPSA